MYPNECEHGRLKRSCNECYLSEEVELMRTRLALAEKVVEAATVYLDFYGGHGEEDDPARELDEALKQYREG